MTTYTFTMTGADGEKTVKRGLTREQALWTLTDLVYGTDFAGTQDEHADAAPQAIAA